MNATPPYHFANLPRVRAAYKSFVQSYKRGASTLEGGGLEIKLARQTGWTSAKCGQLMAGLGGELAPVAKAEERL